MLSLLFLQNIIVARSFIPEQVEISSSCNDIMQDGLYYIKPTRSGPVIPVICSNGYVMMDLSLDKNMESYPHYLSSWNYARNSADYILTNWDDQSTFRQWWLPSDNNTHFTVAPNCDSCEANHDSHYVYYTDSSIFCFSTYNSGNACADNISAELSCNQCDVIHQRIHCLAMRLAPDTAIDYNHIECVSHGLLYRPSMSLIRNACNCYKPQQIPVTYMVNTKDLPTVTSVELLPNDLFIDDNIIFAANELSTLDCFTHKIYLSNADFIHGTYRISECGEYILTEDITLNFNAPTAEEESEINFSPNSIDNEELYWFPKRSDESDGNYKGFYSYIGSYSLGFFAGITVETDNVTINLNGHTLAMHYTFYVQQRYFTLIEMGSKYFLSDQGPSNWDINGAFYAKNLEIKNGNLGLTSHHCIHGMRNENVYIHDITAHKFDVAGLQCNGCQNVKIENCNVGPQNANIPVLGRYAHARALLPRLKQLMNEYGSEEITFYEREPMTVEFVVQRLITQMDIIYQWIIHKDKDIFSAEFAGAKQLFYNEKGWMDGGSSYGIVINGDGAAVVGMGTRTDNTRNISISNVRIRGIYNNAIEKLKTGNDAQGAMRLILFDTIDWMAVMSSEWRVNNDGNIDNTHYIGDAYTDCIFAIYKFVNSWTYLNSLFLDSSATEFVFNGGSPVGIFGHGIEFDGGASFTQGTATGCNTDIQLHSSKGAIGLRIDGGTGVRLDNIHISDIKNYAQLGADWCGEYAAPSVSNEDSEIQYGYTGTRAHGMAIDYTTDVNMSNIYIDGIESFYGEANGLVIYKQCEIDIDGEIVIHGISGGSMFRVMDSTNVYGLKLPNLVPRACAIDVRANTIVRVNSESVMQYNINGYDTDGCYAQIAQFQLNKEEKKTFGGSWIIWLVIIIMFVCFGGLLKIILQIYGQKWSSTCACYGIGNSDEATPLLSSV